MSDPSALVAELDRRYPDAPDLYRRFRNNRGRDGLPDWPAWCYVPLAGAVAVVSGGATGGARPEHAVEIGRVGALMAWRVKRPVWSVSPILASALAERPIPESAPVAPLFRLPDWCIYLDLANSGAFAHLEHDVNTRRPELRLLLDTNGTWDGLLPVALFLDEPLWSGVRRGPLPAEVADAIYASEGGRVVDRMAGLMLHLCSRQTDDPIPLGHAP